MGVAHFPEDASKKAAVALDGRMSVLQIWKRPRVVMRNRSEIERSKYREFMMIVQEEMVPPSQIHSRPPS